ncbi:phosphocholine-specific phospholipase C [Telmatospirillum sp.]|uniref:phosphocholine-specific phospholipase C n=1 Tax=Telmatospirillum sp. TaxID=2079197 RepID=UPI00283D8D01|nr:phospholipase C, phosphocholine-specific [Telmatospirillum sp.]MDR3435934.1 phospholipase C, phosphocholine-specific [Telmatospirillum sp.]
MPRIDRRSVLRGLGASALAAAFPDSIGRALAIEPDTVTGTIRDVKHIVVLTQENRSFDHYFGTLRGVRGFSDPRAMTLSSGNSVFQQPYGASTLLPFRPSQPLMGYQFVGDLPHDWSDAHAAWNYGNNDGWVAAKGAETMVHLNRTDIPFHYALADAFTICDQYHCSIMTSTDPNRYYLWTGWVGQNGTIPDTLANPTSGTVPGRFELVPGPSTGNGVAPGGPVVNNGEQGYNWLTYPERLQAAGVSWKIYQDIGTGLTSAGSWGYTGNPYIGNFGDNSTLYFQQYQDAQPGNPLYDNARTGTNICNGGTYDGGSFFAQLENDVKNDTLPQVSWIAAPQAYCEHPIYPPNWGAWYISNVLQALTANPKVWASTVLIINFDENDGFFDHIVAPTAPMSAAQGRSTVSTVNEIYPGVPGSNAYGAGPYGLGARVPCLIVSPWSKGGWVCSQTFDHTSVLQFIEKRFGVAEPHITPWRPTVAGDLTSALHFQDANAATSLLPGTTSYLSYVADGGSTLLPLSQAIIAAGSQPVETLDLTIPTHLTMPGQEPGMRLSRALPYQLQADARANLGTRTVTIGFGNSGEAGAFFQVRTALGAKNSGQGSGPWGYTVDPVTGSLSDSWTPTGGTAYDLSVHGPNGFFRRYAGGLTASSDNLAVRSVYDTTTGGLTMIVANVKAAPTVATIVEKYSRTTRQQKLTSGATLQVVLPLTSSHHWYDVLITTTDTSFVREYAGRVETGADSVSDPHIGQQA